MGGGLFSKSEKRFSLGQVVGLCLIFSLLFNTTPVQAVTDNLNSALVSVLGTIAGNSSSLVSNSTTIATNSSTLATNSDKLKGLDNLSSLNTNLSDVVTKLGDIDAKLSNSASSGSGDKIKKVYNCTSSTYSNNNNDGYRTIYYVVNTGQNVDKCVVNGNAQYGTIPTNYSPGIGWYSECSATRATYDFGLVQIGQPFQVIEYY